MAIVAYVKTGRTGGTATDLDGIDGNSLNAGDIAFVVETNVIYFYWLDSTAAGAENDPYIIVPDANPGTKNWELKAAIDATQTTFKEITIAAGTATLVGPGNYHIDTAADASTDDLDTVSGLAAGERAVLSPESDARTIVVKNGTNIKLQDIDFTMQSQYDAIEIQGLGGGVVRECWRSSCGS